MSNANQNSSSPHAQSHATSQTSQPSQSLFADKAFINNTPEPTAKNSQSIEIDADNNNVVTDNANTKSNMDNVKDERKKLLKVTTSDSEP